MTYRLSAKDKRSAISFARDLIRLPSPSTEEGQVAERLAAEMLGAGIGNVTIDEMGNVIGRIRFGPGPTICYNGHMDTVRVTDPDLWEHDPFGAEMSDTDIYGLGASDMKASLAAMVYGAKALLDSGAAGAGTLYLVGVVQEEPCEGLAMRHMIEVGGLRPDVVVLGEPTGMELARGHRGRLGLRIRTRGRAAHASAPERGQNAIYDAAKVIVAVELMAPQLARASFLGQGTAAVTCINSTAGSLNAIPDSCEMYVDRRLTTGETEAKALAEMRRAIARESIRAEVEVTEYADTSHTGLSCRQREYFPAWSTPANSPLVQTAAAVIEQVLGSKPRVGKWAFSTDGVYTAGVAGIPTIGFGPGEERYAHAVDERVNADNVVSAANVYANLAAALLVN